MRVARRGITLIRRVSRQTGMRNGLSAPPSSRRRKRRVSRAAPAPPAPPLDALWEGDRAEDRADVVSLCHTALVLVGGSLLLLGEWIEAVASGRGASLGSEEWFTRKNSAAHRYLFGVSVLYYAYDSFHILVLAPATARRVAGRGAAARRRCCGFGSLTRRDLGFLLHHAICVTGLAPPLVTSEDGYVVLCGFIAGEISNPPRLLANFCLRQAGRPPSSKLRMRLAVWMGSATQTAEFFGAVHFALFVCTRVACAHYIAHVVVPYARLWSTTTTACLILAFGALVTWDHVSRPYNALASRTRNRRWRGSALA